MDQSSHVYHERAVGMLRLMNTIDILPLKTSELLQEAFPDPQQAFYVFTNLQPYLPVTLPYSYHSAGLGVHLFLPVCVSMRDVFDAQRYAYHHKT